MDSDGDGEGSGTGDGDSAGNACGSARAIASSPDASGCIGAGSVGPWTHGSAVHSSCPVKFGVATPKQNRLAPCCSTVFSCWSLAFSTWTFAWVIPYCCRQLMFEPNGE